MPDGRPGVDDGVTAALARLDAGETLDAELLEGPFAVDADGFGSVALGLRWDTVAADRVTAHLDVEARHHQPFGIVHGGVWCAAIESMASLAASLRVASSGRSCVGVHNATDFLRSVRAGRVDGVATPLHVGRLQQLWQVVLTRAEDGKTVARGQVRLQNLEPDHLGGGGA